MKLFVFHAVIFLSFFSFGQGDQRTRPGDVTQEERETAKISGQKLKNAVVLFRLEMNQKQIDYYRKYNNKKAANALEEKTLKTNKLIVEGVRAKFEICPVYFFDGVYSQDIIEEKWENILFFSDSLKKDSSIKLPSAKNVFIAEYSFTRGKYVNTYKTDHKVTDESDSTLVNTMYYENKTTSVSAFIMMDNKFNPLTEPFPYYVKLVSPSTLSQVSQKIAKWNRKLLQFISEVQ